MTLIQLLKSLQSVLLVAERTSVYGGIMKLRLLQLSQGAGIDYWDQHIPCAHEVKESQTPHPQSSSFLGQSRWKRCRRLIPACAPPPPPCCTDSGMAVPGAQRHRGKVVHVILARADYRALKGVRLNALKWRALMKRLVVQRGLQLSGHFRFLDKEFTGQGCSILPRWWCVVHMLKWWWPPNTPKLA